MWKEFHSASYTVGTSFGGVDRVAAIMLGCTTKVPAVDSMDRPGPATVGCFVNQHFGSGGGKRRLVVVEGSVKVRLGRQTRVEPGWAQQVECLVCLGDEPAP